LPDNFGYYKTAHDNVLEMFGGENEIKEEYTHVNRQDQKLFKTWDYVRCCLTFCCHRLCDL